MVIKIVQHSIFSGL